MSSGSLITTSTTSTTSRDAQAALADASYQRELDGGLLLRWSTAQDVEGLARLCAEAFRDEEADPPNAYFGHWIEDLMSGRHPLAEPGDFALVEDTATGEIVACAVLMRQTWEYDGIAFPVGRPEAVATKLGYRNRGLIRRVETDNDGLGADTDGAECANSQSWALGGSSRSAWLGLCD